ncbi:MAG: hypothetical protein OEQ39_12540, partial [Gammaproteobacteria bacterium]|nr:hypothetical protein [Gammaproteobacteria bacterium]
MSITQSDRESRHLWRTPACRHPLLRLLFSFAATLDKEYRYLIVISIRMNRMNRMSRMSRMS